MPAQEGLRFLFDIQDKISPKLAKIEAQSKASAAKIDKAFTRASKSHQTNSAKAIAGEERRVKAATRAADMQIRATERVEKAKKKALEKSLARIKRESEAFKRSMTRLASAAAVAFAAVAAKSIQMAGGYDQAMRSVQAKTGATGEVLDKLSAQAREMGRTTVHSATEAARGQAFLAQAGFDANEILQALPATLALATAGELDLASAADIASNVLSGFQMETDQTARVADVLAFAASKTNTSVLQLGSALAKAAPAAKAAGWSLEETTAAIGKLSDAGIQGEEAGTTLNTMLAKLSINGGPAEKLLAKMGITVKDTAGKMLPLNDILSALAPHADDVGLQMELLGTRGAKAGFILGAVAQDARDLTGELKNVSGYAQSAADIMAGGLWGSLKALGSIVDSAYISFGERFAPALQKGLDLFKKLPAPIQEVVVVLGSLVGVMGGLMLILPQSFGAVVQFPGKLIKLAKSVKLLAAAQWLWNAALTANPIGLVVAAVALLAAGLLILYKRMKSNQQAEKDEAKAYKAKVKRLKAEAKAAAEARVAAAKLAKERLKAAAAAEKLAKEQVAAAAAAEKATKAAEEAAEAAEKSARYVQDLADSWTGATLKSGEFLKAVKKLTPEQKKNDRIMDQVLDKYHAMRKILGPFNDELEEQWRNTKRLNPKLKEMVAHVEEFRKEQEKAKKAAEDLNERLATQRRRLLNLPTDEAIQSFEELTSTWEGLKESEKAVATNKYRDALLAAAKAGHKLNDAQIELATSAGSNWVGSFFDTLSKAFEGGGGFMGGIKSLASRAFGQVFSVVGGKSGGGFTDALSKVFSGEGLLGKIGAVGSKIGGTLGKFLSVGLNSVPIVGPFLAAFAPLIMKGLKKVGGKIWGVWKDVWTLGLHRFIGGPDKAEKAGRKTAEAFRQGVKAGLSPEQAAEASKSWNAGWDASVKIAVRDAKILAGATAQAATAAGESMFQALWRAEKKGSEAVQQVTSSIQLILSANATASEEATESMTEDFDAFFTGVTAEQAPKLTEAMIEMFAKARKEGELFAATMIDIFADVGKGVTAYINGLNAIPRKVTTTITTLNRTVPQNGSKGASERRHGGPVRFGTSGPEMFVPSQSRSIEQRGSSGGGVDAKALGKAVADALEGTKVEVDGRKLGRLTVRHQPLAVAELGGRR